MKKEPRESEFKYGDIVEILNVTDRQYNNKQLIGNRFSIDNIHYDEQYGVFNYSTHAFKDFVVFDEFQLILYKKKPISIIESLKNLFK